MHSYTKMLTGKSNITQMDMVDAPYPFTKDDRVVHTCHLIMKDLIIHFMLLLSTEKIKYKVSGEIVTNIPQPEMSLSKEIEFTLLEERTNYEFSKHVRIVNEFYEMRKNWHTSNVGTLIFKDPIANFNRFDAKNSKTFVVYIYNQWSILYTSSDLEDSSLAQMLSSCSVKNCIFTRDKKFVNSADAILVNVHKGQYPRFAKRNSNQKWVLFSMEAPWNTFSGYKFKQKMTLQNFSGLFNWIMTYRSDSDVPVPFGRIIPLNLPILFNFSKPEDVLQKVVPFWSLKQHKILVVTMVSNCIYKDRLNFVRGLMKIMPVDLYGDCAIDKQLKRSCPGYVEEHCSVLEHYFFYLALENSKCRQYLTEKIFYNAYSMGAIPIIWGAPLTDCEKLLPPNSYLHVDHYNSYQHLAWHLKHISENMNELLKYHVWRKHFKVVNEHGFFGTQPMQFCRLCEALNFNDQHLHTYNYDDLRLFFDGNLTCVHK